VNCVILQPSYIPWRGFFHQIQKADVFIFYDDVQYDTNGWRNRNRIKTPNGPKWLTIPVIHSGCHSGHVGINEIRTKVETGWNRSHWLTLKQFYGKAPFFRQYGPALEEHFLPASEMLAEFTVPLTIHIARELGISRTRFMRSSEMQAQGQKTDRLVGLLKEVGASHYISGPAARDYLEEDKLAEAGITLEYMTYDYPEYEQLHPPYEPQVTVLDLLFMKGPEAGSFIWGAGTS
jgi:hypothetical protein